MECVFEIYDGRNNFWQWDSGQRLIVHDETINQVHFSNRGMTHSLVAEVRTEFDGKRVCNVPDVALEVPKTLIVYGYSKKESDFSTMVSMKFLVRERPIPDDYIYDREESKIAYQTDEPEDRDKLWVDIDDNEHPEGIEVDPNLRVEGYAADSLAVGKRTTWNDDIHAPVKHYYGNQEYLDSIEVKNGQILYNVDSGESFIDINFERVPIEKKATNEEIIEEFKKYDLLSYVSDEDAKTLLNDSVIL